MEDKWVSRTERPSWSAFDPSEAALLVYFSRLPEEKRSDALEQYREALAKNPLALEVVEVLVGQRERETFSPSAVQMANQLLKMMSSLDKDSPAV